MAVTLAFGSSGVLLAQDDNAPPKRDPVTNRRIDDGELVYLNFEAVKAVDMIDFIVETTGKTVIPDQSLGNQKITIISDEPMTRNEALNQLFIALLDNSIGVVETENIIRLRDVNEIGKGDVPVIGPDQSLQDRRDEGVIVNKVFRLRYANAEGIADVLDPFVPDWAEVLSEPDSNSIIALCSIGLGKKLERMILALDAEASIETATFYLQYADASTIADQIMILFGEEATGGGSGQRGGNQSRGATGDFRIRLAQQQARGGGQGGAPAGGPVVEMRVVAETRNNSVTVVGSPAQVDAVRQLIENDWDVKSHVSAEQERIVEIYDLRYTDVIQVRDILEELTAVGTGGGGGRPQGRGNIRQVAQSAGGGLGGSTRLADLFKFQALPATNRLIAIAKTSAGFEILDPIVELLDQPGRNVKPMVIELKHADAEELAMELNVVFAKPGLRIDFSGRQEGLEVFEAPSSDDTGGGGAGGGQQQESLISFPWQVDRVAGEDYTPVHELEGRVRIMPIFRSNALLIVGPPHLQDQIRSLVDTLDRAGRQVLITAVIVEVELEDLLSLGIRTSRADIFGVPRDNQLGGAANFTGTENDFLDSVFDSTVLNVNVNVNAIIDLLAQKNNVRILSQPRIFTHDNEQANFFDGNDIQFITDSITDVQTGNLNTSFEFRQVGLSLSVRPRITVEGNVDLLVNLEVSSLAAGTTQTGGQIVNQRVTTTRVLLKDRQTIVISGILSEQESTIKRKVPLLGDLPFIGALFTSIDEQTTRSELVAFITPIVVHNPDENERLNEPYRERLDEMLRPLDEQKKDPGNPEKMWGDPAGNRGPEIESDDAATPTSTEKIAGATREEAEPTSDSAPGVRPVGSGGS